MEVLEEYIRRNTSEDARRAKYEKIGTWGLKKMLQQARIHDGDWYPYEEYKNDYDIIKEVLNTREHLPKKHEREKNLRHRLGKKPRRKKMEYGR